MQQTKKTNRFRYYIKMAAIVAFAYFLFQIGNTVIPSDAVKADCVNMGGPLTKEELKFLRQMMKKGE